LEELPGGDSDSFNAILFIIATYGGANNNSLLGDKLCMTIVYGGPISQLVGFIAMAPMK